MALRFRLFIDYWNFQLNWNQRTHGERCNWKAIPAVLREASQAVFTAAGLGDLELHETRVYASHEPSRDPKFKNWLDSFLDKQPGFKVISRERRWREKDVHCRSCNAQIQECPHCKAKLGRASEKMIDSLIVSDLLTLAWDKSFDVAALLSSDADMVPAVDNLQRHNFKVINATWDGNGHELAKTAWASIKLDDLIEKLRRNT